MNDIKEIYDILGAYLGEKIINKSNFPKLICIEGLSGSGKTTQIEECQKLLVERGYKVGIINIPTQSAIGRTLRSFYNGDKYFRDTCDMYPWINPLFVAIDLYSSLKKEMEKGNEIVLMARGIVSTYVLYIEHFEKLYNEEASNEMIKVLEVFIKPIVIYYLDIQPDECLKRINERNSYE